MKVVINACFGGFSLSNFGQQEYLKLNGKTGYFYKQTEYSHREGKNLYEMVDPIENDDMFVLTKDMGKSFSDFPEGDSIYFSDRSIERTDSMLISLIEKHGSKIDGRCAKLKIVEIPDNVDWEIDEYDGSEHIAEKHKTWS